MMKNVQAIIVMGVSGCGKSSVGVALAEALGWPFYDGDDFHPAENVAKMAMGKPLNDRDRQPWLTNLHTLIVDNVAQEQPLIVACSALKKSYRNILRGGREDIKFVYLKGSFALIYARMQQRQAHYMKAEMLRSQFETLEEPENAFVLTIEKNVADLVQEIRHEFNL